MIFSDEKLEKIRKAFINEAILRAFNSEKFLELQRITDKYMGDESTSIFFERCELLQKLEGKE